MLDIFLKNDIFLFKKMTNIRKLPKQREMIERLCGGKLSLPPLSFRCLGAEREIGSFRADAVVAASWRGRTAKFALECKSLSTPKIFQEGLSLLKNASLTKGYLPMLFLPFLSEEQLQELERQGVSGIDLCGNCVVVAPPDFAIFRGGNRNIFSSSAPIKNIYRKNSSLVGRVFLAGLGFDSVQEILAEINRRNLLVSSGVKRPMSLSTVSKVIKTLEEDLVITRKERIRLLQPDKLLEKLSENYSPPNIKQRAGIKVPEAGMVLRMLRGESQALGLPLIATGISSVNRYAVMQRGDVLSVYCPGLEDLLKRLPYSKTDRFPNLELIETDDETVYFDAREEEDFGWASPVQVYLELMAGDKRDRETAEQVKSFLLKGLAKAKP